MAIDCAVWDIQDERGLALGASFSKSPSLVACAEAECVPASAMKANIANRTPGVFIMGNPCPYLPIQIELLNQSPA
jgi:hypothetical protein